MSLRDARVLAWSKDIPARAAAPGPEFPSEERSAEPAARAGLGLQGWKWRRGRFGQSRKSPFFRFLQACP